MRKLKKKAFGKVLRQSVPTSDKWERNTCLSQEGEKGENKLRLLFGQDNLSCSLRYQDEKSKCLLMGNSWRKGFILEYKEPKNII